jgi:hypothetical protein
MKWNIDQSSQTSTSHMVEIGKHQGHTLLFSENSHSGFVVSCMFYDELGCFWASGGQKKRKQAKTSNQIISEYQLRQLSSSRSPGSRKHLLVETID